MVSVYLPPVVFRVESEGLPVLILELEVEPVMDRLVISPISRQLLCCSSVDKNAVFGMSALSACSYTVYRIPFMRHFEDFTREVIAT